jgi:hypothetical protein
MPWKTEASRWPHKCCTTNAHAVNDGRTAQELDPKGKAAMVTRKTGHAIQRQLLPSDRLSHTALNH